MTLPVSQAALDVALTESRSLRSRHMSRTDVLDRVKAVSLLSDDVHATTEIVADYFGVDVETIKKLVQRNREELEANGYRVVRGSDIHQFEGDGLSLTKVRALALFNRHTILNTAMLLAGSKIAKAVRSYLLKLEAQAPAEARAAAIEAVSTDPVIKRAQVATAHLAVIEAAKSTGVLDGEWLASKAYLAVARGLSEEPEVPEALHPLYVPDFLGEHGLTKKEITSEQSWFSKRVKALAESYGIEVPRPRYMDLVNGQVRNTIAWKQKHLPLFEQTWTTYYAEKYARPLVLELGAA